MQQLKGLSVPNPYQLLLTTRNNNQKLFRSSNELHSWTLRWKLALIEQFQFEVAILPDFVCIDQELLSAYVKVIVINLYTRQALCHFYLQFPEVKGQVDVLLRGYHGSGLRLDL